MPAILSKNCVVMGDIDSYCLVCSTPLPGGEDVLAHIQGSKHNVGMKSIAYFEKYKDDLIRKVKGVYFCEVCNMTFSTAAKVGMHVTDVTHLERKRRQFKRVGTSIVFQNKILISEIAWNGLVEDACVLCNAEFEDCSMHKSEQTHIFKVFQSKVTIDENNNIYRKVDGGCQCLTCNKVVCDKMITEHLNSSQHKDNFVKFDPNENDFNTVDDKIVTFSDDEKKEEQAEANGCVVNETSNNTTDTKTLSNNQSTGIDGKTLFTKPVLMKGKDKPASSKTVTEEVETLAKQHGLSVNKYCCIVYCNICSLNVPATLSCVKEHVAGKKHKDKLQNSATKKRDTKKVERVKMTEFFTSFVHIETVSGQTYVILNDTFCLTYEDFIGLAKLGHKVICRFCHMDMLQANLNEHLRSDLHKNKMENSFIITSLENEFVRQVTSDLYHCGYCGKVETEFDDMLDHLTTPEHYLCKAERENVFQRFKFEESMNRRRDVADFCKIFQLLSNARQF